MFQGVHRLSMIPSVKLMITIKQIAAVLELLYKLDSCHWKNVVLYAKNLLFRQKRVEIIFFSHSLSVFKDLRFTF